MTRLHQVAAMALLGAGLSWDRPERFSDDPDDYDPVRRVVLAKPRLATFTSERPLTKRQRRRNRGRKQP